WALVRRFQSSNPMHAWNPVFRGPEARSPTSSSGNRCTSRRPLIHSDSALDTMVPRWTPGEREDEWNLNYGASNSALLLAQDLFAVSGLTYIRKVGPARRAVPYFRHCTGRDAPVNAGGRHG